MNQQSDSTFNIYNSLGGAVFRFQQTVSGLGLSGGWRPRLRLSQVSNDPADQAAD
jgi:hypothetical protein